MTLLRKESWKQRMKVVLGATATGFAVYCITNPYVLINAIVAPEILRSNLSNSTAMYGKRGWSGVPNAMELLVLAASPAVLLMGLFALLAMRRLYKREEPIALLLLVPATLVLVQFALLAEGKPAEYARFALLPAVALSVLTGTAVQLIRPGARRIVYAIAIIGATAVWGIPYVRGFALDAGPNNTRRAMAQSLARSDDDVPLIAEPAPYSLPPVNLFKRRLLLIDPVSPPSGTVMAADGIHQYFATPISWANKPFTVAPQD
jgi:hypothetical protein